MTTLAHEFRATYAFMERNLNLVKRYWTWELVWLVYSIANSLSVSFIGLGMEALGGSENVDGTYLVLYLVIGLSRNWQGEYWPLVVGVHVVPDYEAEMELVVT